MSKYQTLRLIFDFTIITDFRKSRQTPNKLSVHFVTRQNIRQKLHSWGNENSWQVYLIIFYSLSGKNPPEKSPREGGRGRVKVRLGIGLGLECGGFFAGGFFPRTILFICLFKRVLSTKHKNFLYVCQMFKTGRSSQQEVSF